VHGDVAAVLTAARGVPAHDVQLREHLLICDKSQHGVSRACSRREQRRTAWASALPGSACSTAGLAGSRLEAWDAISVEVLAGSAWQMRNRFMS